MRIDTKRQLVDTMGNGFLKVGRGANECRVAAILEGALTAQTINVPTDSTFPLTASEQTFSITVPGAALGDYVIPSVSVNIGDDVDISGYVTAANTVAVKLRNYDSAAAFAPAGGGTHVIRALVICRG